MKPVEGQCTVIFSCFLLPVWSVLWFYTLSTELVNPSEGKELTCMPWLKLTTLLAAAGALPDNKWCQNEITAAASREWGVQMKWCPADCRVVKGSDLAANLKGFLCLAEMVVDSWKKKNQCEPIVTWLESWHRTCQESVWMAKIWCNILKYLAS